MITKIPLRSLLGGAVTPMLRNFFRDLLLVRDMDYTDLLTEVVLKYKADVGEANQSNPKHIRDLYYRLDRLRPKLSKEDLDDLR
jgi:hypothetical protein